MHKKIAISRVFVCVLLLLLTASLVVSFVAPSLAYFQTIFTSTGYNSAKVELIFDRLDFTKFTEQQLTDLGLDSGAEWGTKANPYVISKKYHVQNLSVLQNNGFFDKATQAYFLVCDQAGKPVAIDCEGMKMAPIGTHANPFTGVIDGAVVAGETTYAGYGTSVSTIANLTVSASVSEPDIGFFGYVSHYGDVGFDEATGEFVVEEGGYVPGITNLLLADVTVESKVTITDALNIWWGKFTGHTRSLTTTNTDHEETHHIGVVVGHAAYATIEDISVFYSNQNTQTFSLASTGTGTTNYYSITGLVGMLEHVNPNTQGGSMIGGAGSGVTDGDTLVEGGFGGGGAISGTLTGYMLAETMYNEHEKYLTANNIGKKDAYNVTEMKMSDGSSLFETVVMEEGGIGNKTDVTYYFFRDTVFTFAMSASSKTTGDDNADYVVKIWDLDTETPSVSGTANSTDWEYGASENPADARRAYKLEAVTSLEADKHYVIAYQDSGADGAAGTTDDVLYFVPIKNGGIDDNGEITCVRVPYSDFVQGEVTLGNGSTAEIDEPSIVNGQIISVTISGKEKVYYDAAFSYKDGRISDPAAESYGLALYAKRNNGYSRYENPPEVILSNDAGSNPTGSGSATEAYAFAWTFSFAQTTKKCAIYQDYSFYGWSWGTDYHRRGAVVFSMDVSSGKMKFNIDDKGDSYRNPGDCEYHKVTNDEQIFTIFEITTNTLDNNGEVVTPQGSGNYELTPMSMSAASNVKYSYDPSRYVFQSSPNGEYSLVPISSLNLNNGKGRKLDQLNHIVKLYEATKYNYKLTIGSTLDELFGTGIFGDWLDTNSGGVVGAYIGTTDQYYTIPAGMVAFYINEEITTEDNPSYINMIVAVNPGQTAAGRIGLYQTTESFTSDSFNLDNPIDSFTLPCSIVATSNDFRDDYMVTVSGYTSPTPNENGEYTTDTSTSYVYLNGEVAFVYYSFEVTEGGIYLLGSKTGPMSVAYFSVSGAAGAGADGSSASPLGNIDFVYANGTNIITVDKKFEGIQDPTAENYDLYYPSYHFVLMLPKDEKTGVLTKIQQEEIKIYRYIGDAGPTGTRRHIRITGYNNAEVKGLADMYEDVLEPTPTS